jgi:hypothetical protein
VLSVARNRNRPANPNDPLPPIEKITTRFSYDIRGNVLTITDALNRPAFTHVYDFANRPLRIDSIDAGIRRTILDGVGNTVEHRDSKGTVVLNAYFDLLNRPTHLWARDSASEAVTLRERLIYGDDPNSGLSAQQKANGNLFGKLYRHYDEAGRLTLTQYDFKGNLLEKERQVINATEILSVFAGPPPDWEVPAYRVNWSPNAGSSTAALEARASVLLDPQIYQPSSTFDALNRVKSARYPQVVDGERKLALGAADPAEIEDPPRRTRPTSTSAFKPRRPCYTPTVRPPPVTGPPPPAHFRKSARSSATASSPSRRAGTSASVIS